MLEDYGFLICFVVHIISSNVQGECEMVSLPVPGTVCVCVSECISLFFSSET